MILHYKKQMFMFKATLMSITLLFTTPTLPTLLPPNHTSGDCTKSGSSVTGNGVVHNNNGVLTGSCVDGADLCADIDISTTGTIATTGTGTITAAGTINANGSLAGATGINITNVVTSSTIGNGTGIDITNVDNGGSAGANVGISIGFVDNKGGGADTGISIGTINNYGAVGGDDGIHIGNVDYKGKAGGNTGIIIDFVDNKGAGNDVGIKISTIDYKSTAGHDIGIYIGTVDNSGAGSDVGIWIDSIQPSGSNTGDIGIKINYVQTGTTGIEIGAGDATGTSLDAYGPVRLHQILSMTGFQFKEPTLLDPSVDVNSTTALLILTPAVMQAGYTINLPLTPLDGQLLTIANSGSADISAITYNPTVENGAGTLSTTFPGETLVWNEANSTWYRVG